MPIGPFHPDIRQWDDRGAEAAMFAQLMYTYGLLKFPFDTGAFDVHIGRTPGQEMTSAQVLRHIASRIPGFQVRTASPHMILNYLDTELLSSLLRKDGLTPREIKTFLASEECAWRQRYLTDLRRFGNEASHYFQEIVGARSAETAWLFLNQGALVAAGDRKDGATLLLMRGIQPGSVRLYSTKRGIGSASFRDLHATGRVDIDLYGCTIYWIP